VLANGFGADAGGGVEGDGDDALGVAFAVGSGLVAGGEFWVVGTGAGSCGALALEQPARRSSTPSDFPENTPPN
jgi:hypothetical protein